SSEAFWRPTFRAPATTRAQNNVAINACLIKARTDCSFFILWRTQREGCGSMTRTCAEREFAILISDVRRFDFHSLRVQERNAILPYSVRRKSDSAPHAS